MATTPLKFLGFLICAGFCAFWLIRVCAPMMIGVPMTYATAPLLFLSLPAFAAIGLGAWLVA